jgi:hypothetical protein
MKDTNNKLGRILELAVKAFILASVAAVMPVPQYARDLSDGEYIVWLARLIWVLTLTVGVLAVLLLVGFVFRRLHD